MATFPIDVSYTPQTTGDHVICYQQVSPVNDGVNFCCMRDTTPSIVGVPKVFQIPDVAIPSCDEGGTVTPFGNLVDTTFNGYVYPVCNIALKTNWSVPVTFVVGGF